MLHLSFKRAYSALAMVFFTVASYAQVTYCPQTGTTATVNGITNVTFNAINSTTAKTAGYVNYSGSVSTIVVPSTSYALKVSLGTVTGATVYARVWIDWNGNGSFNDLGEQYDLGGVNNSSGSLTTLSPLTVTVPAGAVLGRTTMRVAAQSGSYPSICQTGFDGEVLDYGVVVSNCPYVYSTSISPINPIVCQGSSATLTASGGVSYVWSNTQSTASVTVTPSLTTSYSVTATDANGCTATASSSVGVAGVVTINPSSAVVCAGSSATLTATGIGTYRWSSGDTVAATHVTPSATTTYTVTANYSGCSGTASAVVTVNSLPVVSISPSTVSSCPGRLVNLTATTTGSNYVWSNGQTTGSIGVSPAVTSVYSVVSTGSNGCTAIASATVTVNAAPSVTMSTSAPGYLCNNGSDTLTAGGGVSYAWSTGATTAAIITHPTVSTSYTVTATNSSGCTATASGLVPVYGAVTISSSVGTSCPGASVTLTAYGGNAFTWSTGAVSQSITVAPAASTIYKVTATNSYGCTGVDSATTSIVVNANPSVFISGSPANEVSCSGGAVTLTGVGASTYVWSTGATTGSIALTPVNTTVYSVTGTANGCSASVATTVTVYGHALITVSSPTICSGKSDTLTATGGSQYVWSTGDTTATIIKAPGSTTAYSVTATPPVSAGCLTSSATATVNVNASPVAGISPPSLGICAGSSGSLLATGGTSYQWNTGDLTASITKSPSVNTTYSVAVMGSNGCVSLASAVITVNAIPGLPGTVGASRCGAGTLTLTATGAGTSESYRWYTALTGGTLVQNGGATFLTLSLTQNATYYVSKYNTVTGCEGSRWYVTAQIYNAPTVPTIFPATAVTCTGFTADWALSTSSTVLDYRLDVATDSGFANIVSPWNNVNEGFSGSGTVTGLTGGATYYYRVRAENGCGVSVNSSWVSVTTLSSVAPVSTGSSNVGCGYFVANWFAAAGATSYILDVSTSPSFTSFVTGYNGVNVGNTTGYTVGALTMGTTYYYRVRSTNGCSISSSSLVQAVTTASQSACYCSQYGTPAAVTAITNVTFNTINFTNLTRAAGYVDYTGSFSTTVVLNSTYSLSVNVNTGGANTVYAKAWIDWNKNGVFDSTEQYLLGGANNVTNGQTNLSPLAVTVPAGAILGNTIMRVEVKNGAYGAPCDTGIIGQVEDYRIVVANCINPPVVTITPSTSTVCTAQSATLTAGGGVTYAWNTGDTSSVITKTPTSTTIYSVTASNANGCTASASSTVTVISGSAPNLTVSTPVPLTCVVTADSLKASSTTSGATFNWGGGNTTSLDVVTSPGTYTVIATNPANGCTATVSTTVVQTSSPPAATITPSTANVCLGQNFTLTASGGGTYLWSNGATTSTLVIAPAVTTTYTVTVTGTNGCTATASRIVNVITPPTAGITPATDTICSGAAATLTATGGGTYSWSNGSTAANIVVNPVTTTTYSVTVTNAGGCTATVSRTVVVNAVSAGISPATVSVCAGQGATLTASGTGTYLWSTGSTLQAITVSPGVTSTYALTVTGGNGCSATASRVVTVNALPIASISPGTPTTCSGQGVSLTANGGAFYAWSSGTASQITTVYPLTTTGYSVTVTSNSGCTASASVTVTVSPVPAAPAVGSNSPVSVGHTINLTASTIAGAIYHWTGPDTFSATQQNPSINNATTLNSGVYSVYVTVNGCSSSTVSTTVFVNTFTLLMDTVSANPGQQGVIHVKAINFNMMLSAQSTIKFDTARLQYVQTEQYGVGSLASSNFGTTQVTAGVLVFTWTDPGLTGVTLPFDTTFFAIRFNVRGSSGQRTVLNFANAPTTSEFVDTSFNPINYTLDPGMVIINGNDTVTGRVQSEMGAGIQLATVTATGTPVYTYTTDTSGKYSFNLLPGTNYTITPSKSNDSVVTNGITTLDYLLVQRHILGTTLLSSPYKIIAADVNSSGSVTSLDLLYIRSVILGNSTSFPGGKLWAFVPASYVFSNPQNPFPFPSSITLSSVTQVSNQNFIGVKLGDVNNSWNPLIKSGQGSNTVTLTAPEMSALPAGMVSVPFRARDFKQISGMQFTIEWNASILSFSSVDNSAGALKVEYGESKAGSGLLSIFWTDPNNSATTVADDDILFYVSFKVIGRAGDVSPMAIVSRTTAIEIVDNDLNVVNHSIINGSVTIASATAVNNVSGLKDPGVSVMPNPFTDHTQLSFELFNPGDVKIEVYNELGQLVSTYDGNYGVGKHQVELGNNWSSGLYFVRFSTGDYLTTLRIANTVK